MIVSVTRLRVRAWRYLPAFFLSTLRIARQASTADGNVAVALVHWTQDRADLPSWEAAHRRLEQDGRRSKVNYPSDAHTAHRFPPPTTRRTAQVRLK